MRKYRGAAPELPRDVLAAARFGGEVIMVRDKFLRVPVMPNGADPYTRQVASTATRGRAGNVAIVTAAVPGIGGGRGL